jgi:hypothetical protein
LSNVTVVNGIANFTRVNATSSVGCTQPQSIFAYYRSIVFANNSGMYVLSGSTPEKISDKLDGFVSTIDFTSYKNYGVPVFGFQVMVDNILCAAFLVRFTDTFTTTTPTVRTIMAVMHKGKWWFTSQLPSSKVGLAAVASLPINGVYTAFGWAVNSLYQLFSKTSNPNNWTLRTKLWDAGAPMLDKQGVMVGVGCDAGGGASLGLTVTGETEYGSVSTNLGGNTAQWINNAGQGVSWVNNSNATVAWTPVFTGYFLFTAPLPIGGGKYIGLTATGTNNVGRVRSVAVEVERRRRW